MPGERSRPDLWPNCGRRLTLVALRLDIPFDDDGLGRRAVSAIARPADEAGGAAPAASRPGLPAPVGRRAARAKVAMAAALLLLTPVLLTSSAAVHARAAPESFADLADRLLPAVVNISSSQTVDGSAGIEAPVVPPGSPFEDFFREFLERNPSSPSRRATSLGSGFVISPDGFIVTNNHVIQDADEISVILHDKTRLEAEVIGRDPKTDLAVLKIEPKGELPAVKLGDSDKARVGDWVVAIGNPFGFGGSVTAGIISARSRDIQVGPYDDFFQTDASINRGNSGGPMFNLEGEVIGINTAIFSPSGGSVGIGFAIPSNVAGPVVKQLIEHGEVRRGWLGVRIQTVTEELAESFGLAEPGGALVAEVMADGPAAAADVQKGDVIIAFGDRKIADMRELPRLVADTEVDDSVPLTVWRDGREVVLDITIAALDEDGEKVAERTTGRSKAPRTLTIEPLGLTLAELDDHLRERFELAAEDQGVVVTEVETDGISAEKGLHPGDLIVEVEQGEVLSPSDVAARIDEARKTGRKSVLLLVEGQAGLQFVAIPIDRS
ncbi:MAG: DegQ family serine endoprotease [Allosphingosinicella sp.]